MLRRIRPILILVLLGGFFSPAGSEGPALHVTAALAAPSSEPGALSSRVIQLPGRVTEALNVRSDAAMETAQGEHQIARRVENDTMDSATIGIPRDSPKGYYLKNVLYTQCFTDDGAAIHYNYWSSNFGHPGTHGCLGLNLDDAKWFWDWSTLSVVVNVHA